MFIIDLKIKQTADEFFIKRLGTLMNGTGSDLLSKKSKLKSNFVGASIPSSVGKQFTVNSFIHFMKNLIFRLANWWLC